MIRMSKWKNVLVEPATSLRDAIRILDKEALRIVLVVDEKRKLLGTLTDGDVRRALLLGRSIETPISEVMATQPKVADASWSKARLLAEMEKHRLLQLPIVDKQGIIIGMETLQDLLETHKYGNPVFLMSGGFGTRLRPLTDNCPKPLLKVGDKAILELILESFANLGFYNFYISTHYMPEMIREHFSDGSRWNVSIQYIHEESPLGTAGALGLLPKDQINLPLFLMNGDLLTNLNYLALLDFHQKQNGCATMCVREYEHQVPYGVVQAEASKAMNIVEKPVYRVNVNAGIYVLEPELVKSVRVGQKIDMPDLLKNEIESGKAVNLYPINDYWLDIGRLDDLRRAQTDVNDYFA